MEGKRGGRMVGKGDFSGCLNTVRSVFRAEERALLMLLWVSSDVEAPVPVPSPHTHRRQLDGF